MNNMIGWQMHVALFSFYIFAFHMVEDVICYHYIITNGPILDKSILLLRDTFWHHGFQTVCEDFWNSLVSDVAQKIGQRSYKDSDLPF